MTQTWACSGFVNLGIVHTTTTPTVGRSVSATVTTTTQTVVIYLCVYFFLIW